MPASTRPRFASSVTLLEGAMTATRSPATSGRGAWKGMARILAEVGGRHTHPRGAVWAQFSNHLRPHHRPQYCPSMPEPRAIITHDAWLPALEDGRLDEVGRVLDGELLRLGTRDAVRARLRELIEGVWWSGGDGEGDRGEVLAMLREVIPAVSGSPAEPVLALYVRSVCEAAWDLTWDHRPLLAVLDTAEKEWLDHPPAPGSDASAAVRALLALREDLAVESACSTGDLRTTAAVAERATMALGEGSPSSGTSGDSPIQRYVDDLLTLRCVYADAVHRAARSCADFLEGVDDDLDDARRHLSAAEAAFADDHAARSELRSHRVAVERLIDARSEDWLRVDAGSVACLFPFGLRHSDQAQIVSVVKAHGATWSLGGQPLANNPTGLLLVDDLWRGDDPLHRRYEGTQLDLPDVRLLGRDGKEITGRMTVTISQLGNHYCRVDLPLEDALPHDVGALVWLAAPEYGDLCEIGQRITLADSAADVPGWSRLSDLVHAVLHDLVGELATSGLPKVDLSFRPGMYHVVTTVREASVLPCGRSDHAVALDTADGIPTLFGSQTICHPIPAGVGSVAFWARYASPLGTVVDCAGLTDEYLLVSENHTLLASFSSPDYMVATVGQAAEFAASIDGMFAAWQDELSQFYLGLTPHLRKLEDEPDADLEEVLTDLEQRQLRLRQFLTSARVTLLFVSSPALVTSPVMRNTITQRLELRHAWTRRADFTDVAGQALADRVTDLIETWLRRREEVRARREEEYARRNQLRIDTMLAVLTGIGISGVLAMLQTGFAVQQWGSVLLVVLVLVLAAVVGYASFRWSHHSATKAAPDG